MKQTEWRDNRTTKKVNDKQMKKFNNHIVLMALCALFSVSIFSSCASFLEEDPKNFVAETNYYANEQDAISAVNSVYSWLGAYDFTYGNTAGVYHSSFWVAQGLASDEMDNNDASKPFLDQLGTFGYNSENPAILEVWQIHYKAIITANIAINRIPAIQMDETLKNRLINEAKFVRGLLYFNMVRMFSQVPLILTDEPPLRPGVEQADVIYQQIIADLTDAQNLPLSYATGAGKGRATAGAAKGILAKVYLTRGQYSECAELTQEVINSMQYELWDDYADVLKLASRNGKEAIFSVGFGDAGGAISFWEVGQFNVRLLPPELSISFPEISNTQGWQVANKSLYDSFDANDERRDVNFMTQFVDSEGVTINLDKVYFAKFWDKEADPTAGGSANDFPVLRYADILLMNAEANAHLGNWGFANLHLNEVRNRAELVSVDIREVDAFQEEVLTQRRKEFACEGHRWFDLVRTNELAEKVQEGKGISPSDDFYRFPIPLRERDLNPNLPQNPGF